VFSAHGTAYMVMKYEVGLSMKAWLGELGRPPQQDELDRILVHLIRAVDTMHRRDFLHRDIAPDNIVLRDDGTPVLLDFGSSRRVMSQSTGALTGVVKQGFSPPEQYTTDSKAQGPWTDIYALGATHYRCVTGQTPPDAPLRMLEADITSARNGANGTYRDSFLDAIDWALRFRPGDRPQSLREWTDELLAGAVGADPFRSAITSPRSSPGIIAAEPVSVAISAPTDARPAISRPSRPSRRVAVPAAKLPAAVRSVASGPAASPETAVTPTRLTQTHRHPISYAAAIALMVAGAGTSAYALNELMQALRRPAQVVRAPSVAHTAPAVVVPDIARPAEPAASVRTVSLDVPPSRPIAPPVAAPASVAEPDEAIARRQAEEANEAERQQKAAAAERQRQVREQAAEVDRQRQAREVAAESERQRQAREQAAEADRQRQAREQAAEADKQRLAREQAAEAERRRLAEEKAAQAAEAERRQLAEDAERQRQSVIAQQAAEIERQRQQLAALKLERDQAEATAKAVRDAEAAASARRAQVLSAQQRAEFLKLVKVALGELKCEVPGRPGDLAAGLANLRRHAASAPGFQLAKATVGDVDDWQAWRQAPGFTGCPAPDPAEVAARQKQEKAERQRRQEEAAEAAREKRQRQAAAEAAAERQSATRRRNRSDDGEGRRSGGGGGGGGSPSFRPSISVSVGAGGISF
ncbi:MAG: protein kinase, partial [Hyphomicrobiaceae bacterium]